MMWLSGIERISTINLAVLPQYQRVTDRQMDRRTDRIAIMNIIYE